MRKVFFTFVDGSEEEEQEEGGNPTIPAIPEAIVTDPVFQVRHRHCIINPAEISAHPLGYNVQLNFVLENLLFLTCPISGDCERCGGEGGAEARLQPLRPPTQPSVRAQVQWSQ